MKQIYGVTDTQVGYANSLVVGPSYEEVKRGYTNASETVKVEYDEEIVDFEFLVKLYFMSVDPTVKNRQGGDIGTQYRTGIYYTNEDQKKVIESVVAEVQKSYESPVLTEIMPIENFYIAEDYHQDYLVKNPDGYCHIDPLLFVKVRELSRKREY